MAWVRLEDGFIGNPKIAQLTDAELRVWLRVLCYCGSSKDPTVDETTRRQIIGLTPKRVARFSELGLLDEVNGCHEVHDWEKYQPKDMTGADRQARWRARKRDKTVTGSVTESVVFPRA